MARVNVETGRRSPNYSQGRPAGRPNAIYIHHWGNDGQKFDNVVAYLCRSGGNSSAHYVVQGGRVAEIVSPDNRAWHAGVQGNPRGIGIECRPEMSPEDFETVAALIADLRDRYGALPLRGHKDVMNTACPGRWYSRLSELSARADAIRSGGGTAPQPSVKLDVDGVEGSQTVLALQRAMRSLYKDGKITGQHLSLKKYQAASVAVMYGTGGSMVIKNLQGFLNTHNTEGSVLTVDGQRGPATIAKLQGFLNRHPAVTARGGTLGLYDAGTVKGLQQWLNSLTDI